MEIGCANSGVARQSNCSDRIHPPSIPRQLDGICNEVAEILKDKLVATPAFESLKRVVPLQIVCAGLTVAIAWQHLPTNQQKVGSVAQERECRKLLRRKIGTESDSSPDYGHLENNPIRIHCGKRRKYASFRGALREYAGRMG